MKYGLVELRMIGISFFETFLRHVSEQDCGKKRSIHSESQHGPL